MKRSLRAARPVAKVAEAAESRPMANICMTKKSAVREHEKLVKVLRSGKREELSKEAKEQSSELAQYRKKDRKPSRAGGR